MDGQKLASLKQSARLFLKTFHSFRLCRREKIVRPLNKFFRAPLSKIQNILHIVEPWFFFRQPGRGADRATGKHVAGHGPVG